MVDANVFQPLGRSQMSHRGIAEGTRAPFAKRVCLPYMGSEWLNASASLGERATAAEGLPRSLGTSLPEKPMALYNSHYSGLRTRITESLKLEKTSKIIKTNHQPSTTTPAKPRPERGKVVLAAL